MNKTYNIEEEKKLTNKRKLVDETIDTIKVSKYEVVRKMFNALKTETEELKKILFEDLAVTVKAKDKAEKISKIAFNLQACLDHDNGGPISENLMWLYRFIRYMAKRIQDNDDMNYVQPAFKVISLLNEAWEEIPEEFRDKRAA